MKYSKIKMILFYNYYFTLGMEQLSQNKIITLLPEQNNYYRIRVAYFGLVHEH